MTRTKATKNEEARLCGPGFSKKENARPALLPVGFHVIVMAAVRLDHGTKVTPEVPRVKGKNRSYNCVAQSTQSGGVPWKGTGRNPGFEESASVEIMSKRRRGFPSETQVKRGFQGGPWRQGAFREARAPGSLPLRIRTPVSASAACPAGTWTAAPGSIIRAEWRKGSRLKILSGGARPSDGRIGTWKT